MLLEDDIVMVLVIAAIILIVTLVAGRIPSSEGLPDRVQLPEVELDVKIPVLAVESSTVVRDQGHICGSDLDDVDLLKELFEEEIVVEREV